MKETKRGAKDIDTFNGMKNAALKEGYTESQIHAAIENIKEKTAAYMDEDQYDDLTADDKDLPTPELKKYVAKMYRAIEKGASIQQVDKMIVGLGKLQNAAGIKETEEEYLAKKDAAIKQAMDTDVEETVDITNEDKRTILQGAIDAITSKYEGIHGLKGQIKGFLEMHSQDIIDGADPVEEFNNYIDANFDSLDETDAYDNDEETQDMIDKMRKDGKDAEDFVDEENIDKGDSLEDIKKTAMSQLGGPDTPVIVIHDPEAGARKKYNSTLQKALAYFEKLIPNEPSSVEEPYILKKGRDVGYEEGKAIISIEGHLFDIIKKGVEEKKGKDHDGDGDVDGDDYMASKDKAIKKAMGKDEVVRENLKAIITKILEEDQINEAATNVLSAFGDDYAGFEGMKSAINGLENIVTDIEQYYEKTRTKIQKIYDTLGEIRNEEGLKVGGFLAPAVEQAFSRDLRPVIKQGFTKGLNQPKVKTISSAEIAAARERGEIDEFTEEAPKKSVFTPVYESKKKK